MNTWPNVVARMPDLLTELKGDRLRNRDGLGKLPDRGVYVFYEKGKPLYVGRTNGMRQRIQVHGRPSSTHNSASFAYLLAVERASRQGVDCRSQPRKELERDSEFSRWFSEAKERVKIGRAHV